MAILRTVALNLLRLAGFQSDPTHETDGNARNHGVAGDGSAQVQPLLRLWNNPETGGRPGP